MDHLILSEEFACPLTEQGNAADAALALVAAGDAPRSLSPADADGCWSVSEESGAKPRHHPAFQVRAANTSGCGDVFHGAYAFRLARGDSLEERIRFASAAAAVKAQQPEIPRLAAVESFLRESARQRGSGAVRAAK